jgi:hypothetical protein
VVARSRYIGERRPPVGRRIVDLVRWGVAAPPADATNCVDLATEHGSRQRAARRGQGGEPLPPVARRIVFVHVIGRRPALDEAADDVELVI